MTSRRTAGGERSADGHFAAVLRTCKLVHDEAAGVLYQQTLFRITLGAGGVESVGRDGKLQIRQAYKSRAAEEGHGTDGLPLHNLSLFNRMQNVQLDLNFGAQVNPIWDALPVIRAIVATLGPQRKQVTASLRFGLMTAITCARLPEEPWKRFVQIDVWLHREITRL